MKKLWKWLFRTRNKQLDIPVVMPSVSQGKSPFNKQMGKPNFEYVYTYEEAIELFNKLQVGKEYGLVDHVTGEWKKQTYQPPNEQETFEKMMHGIRYDWIRP